jgi:tetratricopeptide (TPR) repeat protein
VVLSLAVSVPLIIARLRAEVHRGRVEGEQLRRAVERANLNDSCQRRLRQGMEGLRQGTVADLHTALERFRSVLEQVPPALAEEDEDLAQLRLEAKRWAAEAEQRLADLEKVEDARRKVAQFFPLRDRAFFLLHRDLVTGTDPASPQESRQAARAALVLFLDLDGAGPARAPDLGRYEPRLREKLRTGLYEAALLLAEAAARSGQPDEALRVLDRVAWYPETQVSHLRRARYLEMRGDFRSAEAERKAAGTLKPQTALEWFLSGQDKVLVSGDLGAAAPDLDAALRLEPDLFWACFLRALARLDLRRPGEARGDLAVCIHEQPGFVWGYLLHAFLCGQAGDFDEAAADFARAEELVADDSARYVLHNHRGLTALARKEVPQAVDELRHAVRLKADQYIGHVNLARALEDGRDLDGAVAALGEALRLEPGLADLHRTRARLHRLRHDSAAARADLTEAIRLGLGNGPSPALARDCLDRGLLLHAAGRDTAAARDCALALDLKPDLALAWHLHGEILLKQGRPRDALAAFDRYLDFQKAPTADVFLWRAQARADLGDFARLPEEYTRALALRPDADVYAARGWTYTVNEAMPLARKDFETALRLVPRHADALIGRGLVRVRAGDWRSGAADAEEGLRLAPGSYRQR